MTDPVRLALEKLLRQVNNIEVLGEWSAQDINRSSQRRFRAQVDAVVAECRAALAAPARDVQPVAWMVQWAERETDASRVDVIFDDPGDDGQWECVTPLYRSPPARDSVIEEMAEALQALHDDNVDYLTINKLGGVNNHCLVRAREAIAAFRALKEKP